MKFEKFEANLILTLIYFDWIEKGSGLSQSDLIFMHLSVVSGTVEGKQPKGNWLGKIVPGAEIWQTIVSRQWSNWQPIIDIDDTFFDSAILKLLLSFVVSLHLDSCFSQSVTSMIQFWYMQSTFIQRVNEIDFEVEWNWFYSIVWKVCYLVCSAFFSIYVLLLSIRKTAWNKWFLFVDSCYIQL